jgi:hypothetical protein
VTTFLNQFPESHFHSFASMARDSLQGSDQIGSVYCASCNITSINTCKAVYLASMSSNTQQTRVDAGSFQLIQDTIVESKSSAKRSANSSRTVPIVYDRLPSANVVISEYCLR